MAARQQMAGQETVVRHSVAFPGLVRPRHVTTLARPAPLTVNEVLVSVGDRVAAGQPLLTFDDVEATRQVERLTFEAKSAREQTAQLERQVAALEHSLQALTLSLTETTAKLAVAERDAGLIPTRQWRDSPERARTAHEQALVRERRLTELAAAGLIPSQELDDARFAVRVAADDMANAERAAQAAGNLASLQNIQAKAQADMAIAQYQRMRREREADLAQARLRQEQAEAALAHATAQRSDNVERAPAAAVVAAIQVAPGDRLVAGVPLLKLAILDSMIVEADAPATLVNKLQRGGPATVSFDDGLQTVGRILTIAPLPGEGGAHAVEVEFPNLGHALLAGRAATVRFSE